MTASALWNAMLCTGVEPAQTRLEIELAIVDGKPAGLWVWVYFGLQRRTSTVMIPLSELAQCPDDVSLRLAVVTYFNRHNVLAQW
jgi:hypothetical protein